MSYRGRQILRWSARLIFTAGAALHIAAYFTGKDAAATSTNVCVIAIGIYTLFGRTRRFARRRDRGERVSLYRSGERAE